MSGVRAGTAGRLRTRRAAAPGVLRPNAWSCFSRTVLPTRRVSSARLASGCTRRGPALRRSPCPLIPSCRKMEPAWQLPGGHAGGARGWL